MPGSLAAIEREAGIVTRSAILDQHTRLRLMEETFSRVIRNATIVAKHSELQQLDYASSGHTGFTSSAAFAAHTGAANHPYLDAIETWTAVQTFTPEAVFNGGIDLGTSGRFDSNVADAAAASSFLVQPTVTQTSGTDRNILRVNDAAGNPKFTVQADGSIALNAVNASGSYMSVTGALTQSVGMAFSGTVTSAGTDVNGISNCLAGVNFTPTVSATSTSTSIFGASFVPAMTNVGTAQTNFYGGTFGCIRTGNGSTVTNLGGILIRAVTGSAAAASTLTNAYGINIEDFGTLKSNTVSQGIYIAEITKGDATAGRYGIRLAQTNTGYKAIAFRDGGAFINSDAANDLDLNATTNIDFNIGASRYANVSATSVIFGNLGGGNNMTYTMSNNTLSFTGNAVVSDIPSNTDSQTWLFTSNRADAVGVPDAFTFRAAGANANITLHTDWLDTSNNSLMTLSKVGVLTLPLGNALVVRDTGSYFASDNANDVDVHATTGIDLNISANAELRIAASLTTVRDGHNFALNTGTGTKIGTATTQKLAFWNSTPVAQYATTGTTTGYTGGGGTALTHSDTFTGNTGATAYTIGDVVKALKTCGVMAA